MSGFFNNGNDTSGFQNHGDFSSGFQNMGDGQTGLFNSGNDNTGIGNSGSFVYGIGNTAMTGFSSGLFHSGVGSSGVGNSGDGSAACSTRATTRRVSSVSLTEPVSGFRSPAGAAAARVSGLPCADRSSTDRNMKAFCGATQHALTAAAILLTIVARNGGDRSNGPPSGSPVHGSAA
ncbi:pentapeptide repeats family protein [Mycobacterium kansasii]|uniref:Pentapeptide repeats family protein n=1 Tax=Mycobacterium kansasii TaxID=1768 RepID=A0A1V3XU61_MYCKA|nr:pentapeptide repeats family protein [Mycobacterium kansasii]